MRKKKMTPFEQALLDATLEEFADIPNREEEIDVTFSSSFDAEAEKLIQNTQRESRYAFHTAIKRVALIAIITALLITTAIAIPFVRQALICFFLHDAGAHDTFSFDPEQAANASHSIEAAYYPTYIPDEYQLSYDITSIAAVAVGWSNPNNWRIDYTQLPMPDHSENSTRGSFNAEAATTSSLVVNGYEVIRIEDAEAIYYVWTNHESMFSLICKNTIPEKEIVKIFDRVQIDPNAVIFGAE